MKYRVTMVLLGILLIAQPVWALDLQSAKVQGLVGETATGYLAPVQSSHEVQQLVEAINGKRKIYYQKISQRNKTSLAAVEHLAGKKAIQKTARGQFIQVNGAWKKK